MRHRVGVENGDALAASDHAHSTDIVNSFRLVINAEPMTYRAESADVKRQWVAAIKAATDDVLRTRKQKTGVAVNGSMRMCSETIYFLPMHFLDSGKKASTVDAGASADSNAADTLREAFADITDTVLNSGRTSYSAATTSAMAITSLIRDENINPDLAWIKDMPDELDVYIAHREFDKAVQCIERGISWRKRCSEL